MIIKLMEEVFVGKKVAIIENEMEDAEECAVNHLQERTKELAKERGVKGEVKFYKQTHKKEFSVYGAEQIMELGVEVIAYGNILS